MYVYDCIFLPVVIMARMRNKGYCSWVCVCLFQLINISPLERLFVLKTIPRTQRAMKSYGIICHAVAAYRDDVWFVDDRAF